MLLIPCPWCGPRDEPEFQYAGEPAPRPVPAEAVTDAAWSDYLHVRANVKGTARELWCHGSGCAQWFVLTRNTATHEILEAAQPGAAT